MAYPVILVDSATGSDSGTSGAGPSTALTGSAASVAGTATSVSITDAVDLSGVVTDGSACLYYNDTTAGHRRFDRITAISGSSGAWTVTVANGYTTSTGPFTWAIGGKRASIAGSVSKLFFDNNSAAGDAMPGWTVRMQSGHAETIAASFDTRRAGDATGGPITLEGESGAATVPVLTFSNNGNGIVCRGAGQVFQDFELRNSHPTKTASVAFISGSAGPALCRRLKVAHSTNNFWKAFAPNVIGYVFQECEIGYCANVGFDILSGATVVEIRACRIHHCVSHGIQASVNGTMSLTDNLIVFNGDDGVNYTNSGISVTGSMTITRNTIHGNASDGFEYVSAGSLNNRSWASVLYANNFITYNGGYGVNFSGGSVSDAQLAASLFRMIGNNFYTNTSGPYNVSLPTVSVGETSVSPSTITISATTDYQGATNGTDFTPSTASLEGTAFPTSIP